MGNDLQIITKSF